MRMKLLKRLLCTVLTIALLLAFGAVIPSAAAVEGRTSVNWCERIAEFQQVNASITDTRPALTMVVQRFLATYKTRWSNMIMNSGGIDGYFGGATKQCVEEYQSENNLYVDGAVGPKTWYSIGEHLWDETTSDYVFFSVDRTYLLRALKKYPYTFYYSTFEYYDMQWVKIPKYN